MAIRPSTLTMLKVAAFASSLPGTWAERDLLGRIGTGMDDAHVLHAMGVQELLQLFDGHGTPPFRSVGTECVNNFETPVVGSLVSNAALPRVRVAWVLES